MEPVWRHQIADFTTFYPSQGLDELTDYPRNTKNCISQFSQGDSYFLNPKFNLQHQQSTDLKVDHKALSAIWDNAFLSPFSLFLPSCSIMKQLIRQQTAKMNMWVITVLVLSSKRKKISLQVVH